MNNPLEPEPIESMIYSVTDTGMHKLTISLFDPIDLQIRSLVRGTARLAVVSLFDTTLLLHSFGIGLPWAASPLLYWLLEGKSRNEAAFIDHYGLLSATIQEVSTGEQLGERTIVWDEPFGSAMYASIRAHWIAAESLTEEEYNQRIAKIFTLFPDNESLLKVADAQMEDTIKLDLSAGKKVRAAYQPW